MFSFGPKKKIDISHTSFGNFFGQNSQWVTLNNSPVQTSESTNVKIGELSSATI